MNFGSRISAPPPRPPEKGSFPLDHFGECRAYLENVLACMQHNQQESSKCRDIQQQYIECRMERGLMTKERIEKLGFGAGDITKKSVVVPSEKKEQHGWVAGLGRTGKARDTFQPSTSSPPPASNSSSSSSSS